MFDVPFPRLPETIDKELVPLKEDYKMRSMDYLDTPEAFELFENGYNNRHFGCSVKYANFCYVGGGFSKNSLHNILEPSVFSCPVIIGNLYYGFKEAEDLIELGGVLSIKNSNACIFSSILKQFASPVVPNIPRPVRFCFKSH